MGLSCFRGVVGSSHVHVVSPPLALEVLESAACIAAELRPALPVGVQHAVTSLSSAHVVVLGVWRVVVEVGKVL